MRRHLLSTATFVIAGLGAGSPARAQMPPPLPPSGPPQPAPPVNAPAPSPSGWAPAPGYPPAAMPYRDAPGPPELRYVEGRQVPPGYHPETRIRKGLVISGSILLGVPYFLSLSVAASSKNTADRWLYAPLVGPFADLASRKDNCTTTPAPFGTTTSCAEDSSARFFLMADGLMQMAGTTLLILGLALPQHLLVRDDAPYVGAAGSRLTWSVAPRRFGRSGYGLGLDGSF